MFDTHFEMVYADNEEARRLHYRLRYQVYCQETGFEDPEDFPDMQESDQWDDCSAHFLVRARTTGEWIAAMRLILPKCNKLPIEEICDLDDSIVAQVPHDKVAEISRLCMVSNYRRRKQEINLPCEEPGSELGQADRKLVDRRVEPEILLGMLRGAAYYCRARGIRYLYFLCTRALERMIGRLAISMQSIGPLCIYRGERYPFLADLESEAKRLSQASSEMALMLARVPAYSYYSELKTEDNKRGNKIDSDASLV